MKQKQTQAIKNLDKKYIWHPYTDIDNFEKSNFPLITHAKGSYLYDSEGKKYIDAFSSWWCVNLGHGNKKIISAIKNQTETLQHAILGGMSNPTTIKLAEALVKISGMQTGKCFFASDGSSATEAAIRIALQYWQNIGNNKKLEFISLQDGYHGDTMGAIGLGYIELFHKEVKSHVKQSLKAISPHCAKCPFKKHPSSCQTECFVDMENLIKNNHQKIAGVFIEPICQGAAGIRIYPKEYLQKLSKLCKQYEILLICDEIAVGFYRTGEVFASKLAKIEPDIILVGKGLTGGYLPMSAVISTDKIFNSFRKGRTFFYGNTFAGNPIAASAALATIKSYKQQNIEEKIKPLCKMMSSFAKKLQKIMPNSFSSSLGMILSLQLSDSDGGKNRADQIAEHATKKGVMLRPLNNTMYIWPPLNISQKNLNQIFLTVEEAIKQTNSIKD